jgi:hypothetical protein
MNAKNLLISGIAGSVVYFLLGWLFYGVLFTDLFPSTGGEENLVFIYVGCLAYTLLLAYIFLKWAAISVFKGGALAGITIGFFFSVSMNFFMYAMMPPNWTAIIADVLITMVSTAITGGIIALVIGKLE